MAEQISSGNSDLDQGIHREAQTIHHSLKTRQKTIYMLRQLAREADSIHQGCAASSRDANITGAVGGGFGMAAGGLTIASGGLAAPFVLASLTCFGVAFSFGGRAWSVKNQIDKDKRNKKLRKEILEQLTKDEKARKDAKFVIRRVKKGDFGEPSKIFRELHMLLAALGGVGMIFGSAVLPFNNLLECILNLPSVTSCIPSGTSSVLTECATRIAETAALEGMEEVSQQSAASAVKYMRNGVSKNFVQRDALIAAQKAYENAFEEIIENAAAEAAKNGGNITAQETAKEAAKETAAKAATRAAKSAAEQSAKTAARVTGSVTLVFGVLTSVWEGYNAYQNHCETQKESQLGRELRDLADYLEKHLKEHMNEHNET